MEDVFIFEDLELNAQIREFLSPDIQKQVLYLEYLKKCKENHSFKKYISVRIM